MNIEDSQRGEEAANLDKNGDELVAQDETHVQPDEPKLKMQKLGDNGEAMVKKDSSIEKEEMGAEEEEDGQPGTTKSEQEKPVESNVIKGEELDEKKAEPMARDNSAEGGEEKRANGEDDGQVVIISEEGKEPIILSIWVWEAVLKFITRMEMAERVSLVCHGLKKLCWPRLHGDMVKPHMVEQLCFYSQPKAVLEIERGSRYSGNHEEIPIANAAPPPDYIQGFKFIHIYYLDSAVLRFIRQISPLLANLSVHVDQTYTYDDLRHFFAALNGSSILYLYIASASFSIWEFRQQLPGLLEKIIAISVHVDHNKKDWLALNELILAKLDAGKFFFSFNIGADNSVSDDRSSLIDNIKQAFQTAVQPASFIIEICYEPGQSSLDEFQLENEQTGELLILETSGGAWSSSYQLYRRPSGGGGVQQWGEEVAKIGRKGTKFWLSS